MVEWLVAFLFTQAIEVPIYFRVVPAPHRFVKAFGASLITHPIVWWGFRQHWPETWPYLSLVGAAEAFAIAVEAVYLRLLGTPRPLLWSVVANAASEGTGLLVYALLGKL